MNRNSTIGSGHWIVQREVVPLKSEIPWIRLYIFVAVSEFIWSAYRYFYNGKKKKKLILFVKNIYTPHAHLGAEPSQKSKNCWLCFLDWGGFWDFFDRILNFLLLCCHQKLATVTLNTSYLLSVFKHTWVVNTGPSGDEKQTQVQTHILTPTLCNVMSLRVREGLLPRTGQWSGKAPGFSCALYDRWVTPDETTVHHCGNSLALL